MEDKNSPGEKRLMEGGYRPRGQRGYQPKPNPSHPLDPLKLTPPKGGSAVQPATNQTAKTDR